MFKSSRLFIEVPCPAIYCDIPGCFFSHSVSKAAKPKQHKEIDTDDRLAKKQKTQVSSDSTSVIKLAALSEESRAIKPTQPGSSVKAIDQYGRQVVVPAIVKAPADAAYKSRVDPNTPKTITIPYASSVKIAHELRLKFLQLFHAEFLRIYSSLTECAELAETHAKEQEKYLVEKNSKGTYKVAAKNAFLSLKRRQVSLGIHDTGVYPDYKAPAPERSIPFQSLVHSTKILEKWGFLTSVPIPDLPQEQRNDEGHDRICDRCNSRFIVTSNSSEWGSCTYHPGRMLRSIKDGERQSVWSCCSDKGLGHDAIGCEKEPSHVYKVSHPPRLASFQPFRELEDARRDEVPIAALDCEMIYTTASMELARVTVVIPVKTTFSHDSTNIVKVESKTILDLFVRPQNTVLSYNTQFSGLSEKSLSGESNNTIVNFMDLYEHLKNVGITKNTILVGHGLENDLNAMRIVHKRCIDSALLYEHPRGRPYRLSLKVLCKKWLLQDIQMLVGEGHDSGEDATAALDLVVLKAIKELTKGQT